MDRVLTIEDFRAWGRIGGKRRVQGMTPEELSKANTKAAKASVKARKRRKQGNG
jgi:hypothetical protein